MTHCWCTSRPSTPKREAATAGHPRGRCCWHAVSVWARIACQSSCSCTAFLPKESGTLRHDMTRDIDIDALRMAWFKRHPGKQASLMFHSDRGSQ